MAERERCARDGIECFTQETAHCFEAEFFGEGKQLICAATVAECDAWSEDRANVKNRSASPCRETSPKEYNGAERSATANSAPGTEGGQCYGNQTCDEGLECRSELCVAACPKPGAAGAASGACDDSLLERVAISLDGLHIRYRELEDINATKQKARYCRGVFSFSLWSMRVDTKLFLVGSMARSADTACAAEVERLRSKHEEFKRSSLQPDWRTCGINVGLEGCAACGTFGSRR